MTAAPSSAQELVVRDADPVDAPALLALHHEGFAAGWTMAAWRHRYGQDQSPVRPHRSRVVGAFDRAGRCFAAFGGVLLPCRLGGDDAIVCRGGDVVVDPQLRRTAAGSRLLLRVCEAFLGGFTGSDVAMVYGFPSPGLTRTLVGHCRFEVLSDVFWLAKPAAACGPAVGPRSATIAGELPADLGALLRADAEEHCSGLVRDVAYLRWRYEQNPLGHYVVATTRWAWGSLRGAAIVRCDGPHADAVVVVEWFVPGGDGEAIASLLAAIAGVADDLQRSLVVTSLAGSDPLFKAMQQAHGCQVAVSPYQFLFRSYSQSVTRRRLFDHWRLSAGDLDFL